MSEDLNRLVRLSEVPELVPGSPHISTIRRWSLRGVRGRKLKTYMRGGRVYVDPKDVEAFICSEPVNDNDTAPEANPCS